MVDGQPAVVLRGTANASGSGSGTLAVAATGPAYPLRITFAGGTTSGKTSKACGSVDKSVTRGTMTLSHFNNLPAITAPANAVKITIPSTSGPLG